MKPKFKNTKGITLVALIITIIVLLILAVVAITSISNSNIIKHAKETGEAYTGAEEKEKISLAVQEAMLEGQGNITKTGVTNGMNAQFSNTGWEEVSSDTDTMTVKIKASQRQYKITLNTGEIISIRGISINQQNLTLELQEGTIVSQTLTASLNGINGTINWSNSDNTKATINNTTGKNIIITAVESGNTTITATCGNYTATCDVTIRLLDVSTLTIGTAINTEKYGWKVPGYTVTTSEFTTGIWRLFYQDSKYTYMIADELVGKYKLKDMYSNYANGADVSIEGQRLNPQISTAFNKNNTSSNIRGTAWLTDTEYWKSYTNQNAIFAIASPTIELFAASYNATDQRYTIRLTESGNGYKDNTANNWFLTSMNHGIYNKSTTSWWIASPASSTRGRCQGVLRWIYWWNFYRF